MKHLITAGCSFTSHSRVNLQREEQDFLNEHPQFWYYTHWLKTLKPELDVYNMGSPGSGNLLITGYFTGKVNFELNGIQNSLTSQNGFTDIIILSLTTNITSAEKVKIDDQTLIYPNP